MLAKIGLQDLLYSIIPSSDVLLVVGSEETPLGRALSSGVLKVNTCSSCRILLLSNKKSHALRWCRNVYGHYGEGEQIKVCLGRGYNRHCDQLLIAGSKHYDLQGTRTYKTENLLLQETPEVEMPLAEFALEMAWMSARFYNALEHSKFNWSVRSFFSINKEAA